MAFVVGLATVITDELHRVVFRNVLWVILHKLLHATPETGNSRFILVETDDEAVLLVILLHEAERVGAYVTEEFDAGLNTPVVFVVHHQRVAEKEARLIAAHVSIALGATVDNFLPIHFLASIGRLILVDPVGIGPVLLRDQAIVSRAGDQRGGQLFEILVKLLVIQEHPIVVVITVESVLDGSDGLDQIPKVGVAR